MNLIIDQINCRMIEYEKKNAGFFALGRGDRNKLYDTILKKLRSFSD